jgi:hypothetical protein
MDRRGLSEDEQALLTHVSRWGSDGYPIKKVGARWWCWDYRSIRGPQVCFPTKKQAVVSFEAFLDVLRDAKAGRI